MRKRFVEISTRKEKLFRKNWPGKKGKTSSSSSKHFSETKVEKNISKNIILLLLERKNYIVKQQHKEKNYFLYC